MWEAGAGAPSLPPRRCRLPRTERRETVHSGSTETRLRRRFASIYGLDLDAAEYQEGFVEMPRAVAKADPCGATLGDHLTDQHLPGERLTEHQSRPST